MKSNKKGFTIVELVIVIAIIAILAAVLIPTFASLVKKANVSADTQLVRNLNMAVEIEKASSSAKHSTMHEALMTAQSAGYDVDTIVSKSGYNIAWDSKNDRFVLVDKDAKKYIYPTSENTDENAISDPVDYFLFCDDSAKIDESGFSFYLSKNASVAADGVIEVTTGFDAGENTKVTEVKYNGKNGNSVILRTNGGMLTVDAEKDSVDHYGAANYTNIVAIKDQSFHEFGVSAYVRVEKGHFVAESDAKIINLNVAGDSVKITEKSGASVVAYSKSAENITVKVNDETKEVSEVKSADDIKSAASNLKVVAENGEAEIAGMSFATVQDAINAANTGDTVKISKNVDLTEKVTVNKDLTLDLNGKTVRLITTESDDEISEAVLINSKNVTIKDSVNGGKIVSKCGSGIKVISNTNVTIESGMIEGSTKGVWFYSSGTLTINDGNIYGKSTGIAIANNNGNCTVLGGTVEGKQHGISLSNGKPDKYHNTLTISGGTIISSGKFDKDKTECGAIKVTDVCEINITNGNIKSETYAFYNAVSQYKYTNYYATINISGGKFAYNTLINKTIVTEGTVKENNVHTVEYAPYTISGSEFTNNK